MSVSLGPLVVVSAEESYWTAGEGVSSEFYFVPYHFVVYINFYSFSIEICSESWSLKHSDDMYVVMLFFLIQIKGISMFSFPLRWLNRLLLFLEPVSFKWMYIFFYSAAVCFNMAFLLESVPISFCEKNCVFQHFVTLILRLKQEFSL